MSRVIIPREPREPWPEEISAKRMRKAAKALDIEPANRRFFAQDFAPIIYAWFRGEQCLYVGQSSKGVQRLYEAHHVIKDVQPDDVIFVWDVPGMEKWRRLQLESRMIDELRPTLNRAGVLPKPERP